MLLKFNNTLTSVVEHKRYTFCQTWWKDGIEEDGGWKGGGLGKAVFTMETFRWKDGVDKDGGWRGGGVGQAASTVDTFLEVYVAGVERWDGQVDSGIVLAAFGCWYLENRVEFCLFHWKSCRASVGSPIKPYIFRPCLITQKICRNYVEPGTKWPKRLNLSGYPKNGDLGRHYLKTDRTKNNDIWQVLGHWRGLHNRQFFQFVSKIWSIYINFETGST